MNVRLDRRQFVKTGLAASSLLGAGMALPGVHSFPVRADDSKSPNERLRIAAVGLRYQGTVITEKSQAHGDILALCDVDRNVREQARAGFGSTPNIFENYLDMLQLPDIDIVLIGAPDHWHTKMVIDACRAGKDVYCEKPLTLTIDEGKLLTRVVDETKRVVQVGSWQRSDHRFRTAVEMVRGGRIGKLERVEVILGKNQTGGPFEIRKPPGCLNWDLWQGQTVDRPYIEERSHYTFRWWYEYSGGQMTDWGAHHIDIAQWGIGSSPVEIETEAKFPKTENGYNVAIDYFAKYKFANGVEMTVSDEGRNGIMCTGSEGRIFVNRGTLSGKPVDDLAQQPLPRADFQLYDFDNLERPERVGKLDAIVNHMGNFIDCVRSRKTPLSNVEDQHRSVSVCHLGNISMWAGRKIRWDPEKQAVIDDPEANAMCKREQRHGFEIA